MLSLAGKQAVVTGGSSGIGYAIVQCFIAQGAQVHVLDLQPAADGQGEGYACDVSDQGQVATAIGAIGRVDILVNSAGVSHIGKADNTSEADFDRLFRINVKGVYNCLHSVLPGMRSRRSGVILNICSVAATAGLNDRFAYSMSKGAVLSMTLSVAKDYIQEGIRCNCLSPARVHTPFVDGLLARTYPGREAEMFEKLSQTQPIGRMGRPEEIAHAALYLCSEEAGFITGCDYPIDGGFLRLNT
ncbi:MAG: SDR family oxidoreductase [Bacteroidetes bacterium]|nr:SDR family oxidoreductase [Bacteroidota bacterium]